MQLTKLALAVGVAFGGALILHGCGGGSSAATTTTTTTTTTQVAALSTPIAVQVVNGSGAPVTSTVFTVSITGTDASKVVDSTGKAITSTLSTSSGALILGLSSSATPTTSTPVVFNVLISGNGYLPTGQTVTITATGTQINVNIPVVAVTTGTATTQADGSTQAPITNTASGVSGTQTVYPSTAVNSSGTTTQALSLSTATSSTASSALTLSLPAGTTMKDASGNPITGAITANVVSYDATQASSATAFPGGYAATVSTGSGTTTGTFQTTGFAQIVITDASGNLVKSFNPAISATMVIPKGTINPITGKAVAVGDTLGIYSYDETTGTWKQEPGTGTVTSTDASGNFILTFSVTHLSGYASGTVSTSCNTALQVILASSLPSSTAVLLNVTGSGYSIVGSATGVGNYAYIGAPQGKALAITAYIDGAGSKTFNYSDICAAGNPVKLDLSSLVPPPPGTLTGHLYEACFDSTGKPIASTQRGLAGWVQPYNIGTYTWFPIKYADTNGLYSISLQAGSYNWYGTTPNNGDYVPGAGYGPGVTTAFDQVSVTSGGTTTKDFVFQIPPASCKTTTTTGGTTP